MYESRAHAKEGKSVKKPLSKTACVLLAYLALLPVGTILTACFGYEFELTNVVAFSGAAALLASAVVAVSFLSKETVDNRCISFLIALLAPISLVNAVFSLLAAARSGTTIVWVLLFSLISCGCSLLLTVRHGMPNKLRAISVVLTAAMFLPFAFFAFMMATFGNIGQSTVIKTVPSPDGSYYARVIDDDQGALGGSTIVDVCENKAFNAGIFTIRREPQMVYYGDWGYFDQIKVHWKDSATLIVDGKEHSIS